PTDDAATHGAAPPDARVTAAAKDDRVGDERGTAAVVHVERKGAEAGAVGDQQSRYVVFLDVWNAPRGDLGGQRLQDCPTGVVAGVAGAPPPVGAEEPLIDATVLGASQLASPRGQLFHCCRRLAHQYLDDPRITEQI